MDLFANVRRTEEPLDQHGAGCTDRGSQAFEPSAGERDPGVHRSNPRPAAGTRIGLSRRHPHTGQGPHGGAAQGKVHTVTRRLKLMTYNIHSGVGVDRRYDLGRIRRVLTDERPDIAALQEVECGSRRTSLDDQSGILAADLALTSSFCATRRAGQGSFGIGVLSRFPVLYQQQYDLSYRSGREPRYCLRVDLEI